MPGDLKPATPDPARHAGRPTFVINESAGSAPTVMEAIESEAQAGRCDVRIGKSASDAARAMNEAVDAGQRRIVVCGGDGTVRSAVNALRPRLGEIEIGLVPAGTGNDLARSLRLPERPADAVRLAIEGSARPIDVLEIEGIEKPLALNCITAGIGAGVSGSISDSSKRMFGPLAYWVAALAEIMSPPQLDLAITLDRRGFPLSAHGFAIANGRTVGGGFNLAPDISLDDGLLDLLVLPVQPVAETILDAIGSLLGRDHLPQGVLHARGTSCSVLSAEPTPVSVDGESMELSALSVRLHPGLARFVCDPLVSPS